MININCEMFLCSVFYYVYICCYTVVGLDLIFFLVSLFGFGVSQDAHSVDD
jgi:hypothetical protein